MMEDIKKGRIHLYCGDGKGKTTAAIGLVVRAVGRGYRVIFAQFLKTSETGELLPLRNMGVTILRGNLPFGFTWELSAAQKQSLIEEHNKLLHKAISLAGDGENTLLILDELVGAYAGNVLHRDTALSFLREKPKSLELVITGRNPTPELLQYADYITEMRKQRHPMDQGLGARMGIEF
ncbi:MAG: cob(I)yrinic acid a,c-diamide adenosyltransferase [Oscillospiraceae bacterium]